MKNLLFLVLFGMLFNGLSIAQTFNFVADINPTGDSDPRDFINYNSDLYFSATDDSITRDLWKLTSGTTTPINISNFPSGSYNLYDLTVFQGKLFYSVTHPTHGSEIWVYDGTSNALLADINPGIGHGFRPFYGLTVYNNLLLFAGDNGINGLELYKTDGTAMGTSLVKDINVGADSSIVVKPSFALLNNKVYFGADDGINGYELWETDGTTNGTTLVKDIEPGAVSSGPSWIEVFNNELFFYCQTSTYGNEVWKSDGTDAGTEILKDINPGTANGIGSFNPAILNNKMYFVGNETATAYELYSTDGTTANTELFKDINPMGSSFIVYLTTIDGYVYFQAGDGINHRELWKTDGTNTTLIEVNPIGYGYPTLFTKYNGRIYLRANVDSSFINRNYQLLELDYWTDSVQSIAPAIAPKFNPLRTAYNFFEWEDKLYFAADYDATGSELWSYSILPSNIEDSKEFVTTNIYPNPSNDFIHFDDNIDANSVSIYNTLGQLVLQSNEINTVDVSKLGSGAYVIKIQSDKLTYVSKIVKL